MAGYIEATGEDVVQPDSALMVIKLMYSLIPLVLMAILAVIAFMLSKLAKKIPEYEAEIDARAEESKVEIDEIA